jgi:hypothetical protein
LQIRNAKTKIGGGAIDISDEISESFPSKTKRMRKVLQPDSVTFVNVYPDHSLRYIRRGGAEEWRSEAKDYCDLANQRTHTAHIKMRELRARIHLTAANR